MSLLSGGGGGRFFLGGWVGWCGLLTEGGVEEQCGCGESFSVG